MSSALQKLAKRATPMKSDGTPEVEIPLNKIRFDPKQPRQAFHRPDGQVSKTDEEAIVELAESIDAGGLIQAITVEEVGDGTYLVVVGERRTRAHLRLGKPTIRAIIRNDLKDPNYRLLYQLAENVNREDLSDAEIASSIRDLMKGSEGVAPLNGVQIAKRLGKSQGWVSRFVKFGDDEQQRLWVVPGIADTVEKVYRLSILPKAMQVEIIRRVSLPESDPDRLEKPLNRNVIDSLTLEAKVAKAAPLNDSKKPTTPPVSASTGQQSTSENPASGGVDQTLATLAQAGQATEKTLAPKASSTPVGKNYELPVEVRNSILGNIPSSQNDGGGEKEIVLPPVTCRVAVATVTSLLKSMSTDDNIRHAMDDVQCNLSIPGALAQQMANLLTGMIVDPSEVPAVIQTEVSKLK